MRARSEERWASVVVGDWEVMRGIVARGGGENDERRRMNDERRMVRRSGMRG
jgi:hypothetical protein